MTEVQIVNPIKSTFRYNGELVSVTMGEIDGKTGIFAHIDEQDSDVFKSKRNEIVKALENLAAYLKAN